MSEEKNVQVLWLYDDLLDLYGDSGNLTLIKKRLTQLGYQMFLTRASLADSPKVSEYDMVYIGPGKAKNLRRACEHILTLKDEIVKAIDEEKVILVTGNARLLLGKGYTDEDGSFVKGLELFPYTGEETGKVFISDVVANPQFETNESLLYGFINRTGRIKDNVGPYLFKIVKGAGDEKKGDAFEGNLYKNLFSTWLLGPVLVKNPQMAREFLGRLIGREQIAYDDTLETMALKMTLKEFSL
ncbi:hypothetical protein [Zongyangia hominis]|uniref:CobB/CobQ-like glutamine amidotransferase domain-containing protein n=1 Tax=Zongyangia hominis TaxID=2763677 RepID=A0A926EDG4_9FIRM|nr:hypothetical protein [Zongyangia hominis]MBC8571060.1 hypothetical protein [Zongyangia hominis]